MPIKEHYHKLRHFLKTWQPVVTSEVLDQYPQSLDAYPEEIIRVLEQLSPSEQWAFDCHQIIPKALLPLIAELQNLCALPEWPTTNGPLLAKDFDGVKEKKRHELNRLVPLVIDQSNLHESTGLLDLCGGLGHLARPLARITNCPVTLVERDPALIAKGILLSQNAKTPPTHHQADLFDLSLEQLYRDRTLGIGLHTCGALSLRQMNLSLKNPDSALINFGCCYQRLNENTDVNLSALAKEDPFPWNDRALTLAARAHYRHDRNDFETRLLVKRYRSGLHLLLEEIGKDSAVSVGEVHVREYQTSFGQYVQGRFKHLGWECPLPECELNEFFRDQKNKIDRIVTANLWRWQLGRPLEILLLLDRALWLSENGRQVQLLQVFDAQISPRNIALLAK
jgi:hypothetical protein